MTFVAGQGPLSAERAGARPRGPASPAGPPDIAKLRRVAPLYAMEIIGPPLPPG